MVYCTCLQEIAQKYGVLTPDGVPLRGLFVIDKEGTVQVGAAWPPGSGSTSMQGDDRLSLSELVAV